MTKSTITINGRTYDAITGMPVNTAGQATSKPQMPVSNKAVTDIRPAAKRQAHEIPAAAQAIHQVTQRSQTLQRAPLKKPAAQLPRSNHIRKFQPTTAQTVLKQVQHSITEPTTAEARMHPVIAKAMQAQAPQPQSQQLSGSDLKEQLIKERLAEVVTPTAKQKSGNWLSRQPRLATILSSTLALLILGGYLTYITLPSISLKVAASRAGVNATMPEYKPDGYSLDGPITYSPGEVTISYKSNTNTTGYKLVQKETSWDSQAVLDNYVTKLTDNYLTFQERGITVYTFGSKAVWVNGGLLYTVDGDAALSSDQILRLATSI